MESTGVGSAVEKVKTRDYLGSLANVIAGFAGRTTPDELLAQVPAVLVHEFDVARAELWLWDESSRSVYLTHATGQQLAHRRDYVELGKGPIGKVAENKREMMNVAVTSIPEVRDAAGLSHVSICPLVARGKMLGVIASYTSADVGNELLALWRTYCEMSAAALHQSLAAQESEKTITQLSLLFEATRLLNSTLDLAELLELILKIARTEVKADRGTVFLVDAKHQQLWSIVASGLDHQEIRLPFGSGVAGRVAVTGDILNVEDAYTLEYFERSVDQRTGYRTRSLLCLPIRHHTGQIVGVIQLLNKTTGRFTAEDEDFLTKLSGHMAMALENARLHREALEKQRMERDLSLARTIQRSLLPEAPPVVPGYEIAVLNQPCFEVGGDYYDFLNLGPQTLLLVIADVEGKGVSSALVMSNLQATLRALVMHLHSLEVLTLSLNEMIFNDTKSEKFLSIFMGLVDTRRNGLHYINAGHVPPILISSETGDYKLLEEGGTVVGLFPDTEYTRGSAKLHPGDILVCCTDGILEASNRNDDEFGTERLAACVAKHRNKPAQVIVDAVLDEVNAWSIDGVHIDDKVLMVLKVTKDNLFTAATSKKPQ